MLESFCDWGSHALFRAVHRNHLVYNTCWEDPRLDRAALRLGSDDEILMITSAGCNALDYALDAPKRIHCVDVNPMQTALLELKIAAIRELEFPDFFALFGRGRHDGFALLYDRKLRRHLSEPSRRHWDRRTDLFEGSGRRSTFYFRGTSGFFARLLNYYIDLHELRQEIRAMFDSSSLYEQRRRYQRLRDAFWTGFIRWAVKWDATLSLLGVPRAQRKQVERGYGGGIAKFIEDCVESVFTRLSLGDNYFWWLYLNGEYSEERCPEYLTSRGFDRLKGGLVDRIACHTSSLTEAMRSFTGRFSRFVLLDHMDWLSQERLGELAREWQALVEKCREGARVIWRSGGLHVDYVDPLVVTVGGRHRRVGDILEYKTALASELHAKDRVHTYGSFYIADVVFH